MSPDDKPIIAAGGRRQEIKHKLFISYSYQDQEYRDRFEELFGRLFDIKSVAEGEMSADTDAAYIEHLIRRDYISVVTVVVVLVGADTWSRKHVDWEIAAALRKKLDGFSGLLGICLPTHPDYQKPQYKKDIVPLRLSDNVQSGYAPFHDWTENESDIAIWVEAAFEARVSRKDKIDDSRPRFTDNWLHHSKWPPPPPPAPTAAEGEPAQPGVEPAAPTTRLTFPEPATGPAARKPPAPAPSAVKPPATAPPATPEVIELPAAPEPEKPEKKKKPKRVKVKKEKKPRKPQE